MRSIMIISRVIMDRITISITADTKRVLGELARSEDRRVSDLVRELLAEGLERARRRKAYEEIARAMTPETEAYLMQWCQELEAMRGEEG
jgi:hypothetical protein